MRATLQARDAGCYRQVVALLSDLIERIELQLVLILANTNMKILSLAIGMEINMWYCVQHYMPSHDCM